MNNALDKTGMYYLCSRITHRHLWAGRVALGRVRDRILEQNVNDHALYHLTTYHTKIPMHLPKLLLVNATNTKMYPPLDYQI